MKKLRPKGVPVGRPKGVPVGRPKGVPVGRLKGVPVGLIIGLIVVVFSWCLIPVEAKIRTKEEIYQDKSAKIKPDKAYDHYKLGEWCLRKKLFDEAKTHFNKVLELDPKHKQARKKLDQVLEWESAAKYGGYKGAFDKPGADHENLAWEKARTKETEHFIVKTNLSPDALSDICFLIECAYSLWDDFFGLTKKKVNTTQEKPEVLIPKNREEFETLYQEIKSKSSRPPLWGIFVHKKNTRAKKHGVLLTYYFLLDNKTTLNTLLHECTHYIMSLLRPYKHSAPPWLNEGIATYFEPSKVKNKTLIPNLDRSKYNHMKTALKDGFYKPLKEFINASSSNYRSKDASTNLLYYSEGWSLVYFLIHGQDGKYKPGLQKYLAAWQNKKIAVESTSAGVSIQDKDSHRKLFEECMGVPIDQLEEEWKAYILKLK